MHRVIPTNFRYLPRLRAELALWCHARTNDPIEADLLVQAADEAISNAIEHAYHFDATRSVELICSIVNNDLQIRISEDGPGFDFDRHGTTHSSFLAQAGQSREYGLFLIRRISDRVIYSRAPGKNTLCLWRRLGGARTGKKAPEAVESVP